MASNLTDLVLPVASSFGIVDYVVFAIFLSVSGAVGIFSCRGQKTTGEYFFGNRKMNPIPVGISTGVSFMSALSIVGYPAEMYNYGWSFIIAAFSGGTGVFIAVVTVAKIVHPLKVKSLNDYYKERFSSKALSAVANAMVLLCIFYYMGACMFGAVVAFSSITGGQVSIIVGLIIGCSVGVFYTSIGGLKAVIWTDVLQCGIMITGILVVVIKSIFDCPEGMATISEMNWKFGRLEPPPVSFDLTIRHSLWSLTFGTSVTWASYVLQPAMVQRLASLDSLKDCYIVALITSLIFACFTLIPAWAGLNIFGYYASRGCDVLAAGWIEKNDILMYYIRDRLSFPGFQGLFVAALYAGSLSSLSSGLSSASSIIWNDVLLPCFHRPPSELRATLISKIIVVVFGALSMVWSYTLMSFGGLMMEVTTSGAAAMYGAYLSLFVFAILFRHGNWQGGVAGLIFSFLLTMWIGVGSLLHGKSHIGNLLTTTENCAFINSTTNSSIAASEEQPLSFMDSVYSLSYLWLSSACLISFLVVGLIVTACTKSTPADPALLFPVCRPGFCSKLSCGSEEREEGEEEAEEKGRLKEGL